MKNIIVKPINWLVYSITIENAKEESLEELDSTKADQVYNPKKHQIINMKSITLMWCTQSSERKSMRKVANQL